MDIQLTLIHELQLNTMLLNYLINVMAIPFLTLFVQLKIHALVTRLLYELSQDIFV